MTLSQRSMRRIRPNWKKRFSSVCGGAARLFKEGHLIDLAHRGHAVANFFESRFTQERHAFFPRHALDFRSRAAADDHFANAVREIENFGNGRAPAIAAAGALQAPRTFVENNLAPFGGIET